jgi:predicted AlkP superfamily phosphohydrolase/phosphomutase
MILIAWDGTDWRILDPLLEQGALPNLQALLDKGQREVLRSTVSHGFLVGLAFVPDRCRSRRSRRVRHPRDEATHKEYPVTYRSIKARTFLDDLTAAGKNQLLLDVPLTAAA